MKPALRASGKYAPSKDGDGDGAAAGVPDFMKNFKPASQRNQQSPGAAMNRFQQAMAGNFMVARRESQPLGLQETAKKVTAPAVLREERAVAKEDEERPKSSKASKALRRLSMMGRRKSVVTDQPPPETNDARTTKPLLVKQKSRERRNSLREGVRALSSKMKPKWKGPSEEELERKRKEEADRLEELGEKEKTRLKTINGRLAQASSKGNCEQIKSLIRDNKAQTEAADAVTGMTALHFAAENGHLEAVKLLIGLRATLNALDTDGLTPLMHAARWGHLDVVKYIVSQGANVNDGDYYGRRPLKYAVENGYVELIKYMLNEANASPYVDTDDSTSLVMEAAASGQVEVLRLVVGLGGDLERTNDQKMTALMTAAAEGQVEMAKILLELGASIEAKDQDQWTPLVYACKAGSAELVKLFVEKGANHKHKTSDWRQPSHFAAEEGHVEVMRELLNAKIDVEAMDLDGWKVLHYGVLSASTDLMELMLTEGKADVDQLTKDGRTPLMFSAEAGYPNMSDYLISKGADPSKKDNEGRTMLIWAATGGDLTSFKSFHQKGASIRSADKKGVDCLMTSVREGNMEISEYILEQFKGKGANAIDKEDRRPLMFAAYSDHADVCRVLIEKSDANVNSQNQSTGLSPLMFAASHGATECCRVLLENGAKASAVDHDGRIALNYAVEENHHECAEMLIKLGESNVKHEEKTDTRPVLSHACAFGSAECVKLLLKHGADVEHIDDNGKTPLMYACERAHLPTVELLISKSAKVDSMAKNEFDRWCPLTFAIMSMAPVAVPFALLRAHASPDARDNTGRTALMMAISFQQKELIEYLLSDTQNVTGFERDDHGAQAIHAAAAAGDEATAEVLMKRNKDCLRFADGIGQTPFDYAVTASQFQMVAFLKLNGVTGQTESIQLED